MKFEETKAEIKSNSFQPSTINTRKSKIRKSPKNNLTLLEVFICLAICIMIGGLFSVKSLGMMRHHQFRRAVQKVVQEIQLTKVMASCYQTDIGMCLQRGDKGLLLFRKTDEPIECFAHLLQKKIHFPEIAKIVWMENETKEVEILFSSSGLAFCPGVITFYSPSQESFSYHLF